MGGRSKRRQAYARTGASRQPLPHHASSNGFNLNAPFNPGGFKLICDKLVPELQDRGYFRSEYEGTTLRDNLGLSRPTA